MKYLTVINNYKVIIGMTALKLKYTRVQLSKNEALQVQRELNILPTYSQYLLVTVQVCEAQALDHLGSDYGRTHAYNHFSVHC